VSEMNNSQGYSKIGPDDLFKRVKELLCPSGQHYKLPKQLPLIEYLSDQSKRKTVEGKVIWRYWKIREYIEAEYLDMVDKGVLHYGKSKKYVGIQAKTADTSVKRITKKINDKIFKDDDLWIQLFIKEEEKGLGLIYEPEEIYMSWKTHFENKIRKEKKNEHEGNHIETKQIKTLRQKITNLNDRYLSLFENLPENQETPFDTAEETLDLVASPPPSVSEKIFLNDYLKRVELKHRYLDTRYVNRSLPLVDYPLELKETYIKLRATKDRSMLSATALTEETEKSSRGSERIVRENGMARNMENEAAKPLFVEQILKRSLKENDMAERHMVFFGSPGSGKSTLLRYLALAIATNQFENLGMNGFVPIFIDLSEYARNKGGDLITFGLEMAVENIANQSTRKGIEHALRHCINQCETQSHRKGKVLFLMDTLEETKVEKVDIVRQIEGIRNRYEKAVIIVTCRTIDYYESPLVGFKSYPIEKLKEEESLSFIRKWFVILGEKKAIEQPDIDWTTWANERTHTLIRKIRMISHLRVMATNPLYLTFLVLSESESSSDIPRTHANLLKEYVQELILKWEMKKDPTLRHYIEELLNAYNLSRTRIIDPDSLSGIR